VNLGRQLSVGVRLTATRVLADARAPVRRVDDAGRAECQRVTEVGISQGRGDSPQLRSSLQPPAQLLASAPDDRVALDAVALADSGGVPVVHMCAPGGPS